MKLNELQIKSIIEVVKKHPGIDFADLDERLGGVLLDVVTQEEFEKQLVGHCLEKTATLGYKYVSLEDVKVWHKLGVAYENGQGVEQDINKAVELYRKAAAFGYASSQNNLGICFFNGHGVNKNIRLAIEYFGEAAIQGLVNAQDALEFCCKDEEIAHDYATEFFKWFLKLAQLGYSDFQSKTAHCYFHGDGVEKNVVEAIAWTLRSKGGCENFCVKLNNELLMGFFKEEKESVKEFNDMCVDAASNGNLDALYLCGAGCEFGVGSKICKESAAHFYFEAAESGHLASQFRLAELLQNGLSVQEGYRTAEYWYREASQKDHAVAEYAMGVHYADTDSSAVCWYRRGADHGSALAMCALGQCYEEGRGVTKDEKKAIEYYREAAKFREPYAQKKLEEFGLSQLHKKN